jgi:site-specific DNA-methyltransferase (adenine-specific)
MPTSEVILGDCLAILKTLEADSFDSMVTDPPAAIAFMSKSWDSFKSLDAFEHFLTKVFLEAYRVLKPGSHILVWSIPRTSHRTACAIEQAGFVIRDALDNVKDRSPEVQAFLESLTEEQIELLLRAGPADSFVLHMFGQGFPKSHNIFKHLSKLGSKEAQKWSGFGTALKPGVETWWLARKPLQKDTVAEQVLATGTGALNIDGCRVAGDMSELINPGTGKPRSGSGSHYNDEGGFGGDAANPPNPAGRWPANVILQHGPDCRLVGKKNAPASSGVSKNKPIKATRRSGVHSEAGGHQTIGHTQPVHGYANDDGTETIDNWECTPGCPVRALDEQSGNRPGMSGGGTHKKDYGGGLFGGIDSTNTARNDSGGASRFFNQFEPDPEASPFFYTGKITTTERNEGLDELVNDHVTVKSKKLMRHLVRLVTPPKGRVLDPFCGSGSTIVAAIEESMSGTGIERKPEYHQIATKRVQSALQEQEQANQVAEAWDLTMSLESE